MNEIPEASPARLPSGLWGAAIIGAKTPVAEGDEIKMKSRGGVTWKTTVIQILDTDAERDIKMAAVTPMPKTARTEIDRVKAEKEKERERRAETGIPSRIRKLDDGTWGAEVPVGTEIGDRIRLRSSSGVTWTTKITGIHGPATLIASVEPPDENDKEKLRQAREKAKDAARKRRAKRR